ncbi:S1 RNA-binding domain-containing protein [Candidatus Bipolaricaulota bacterium]|nr:S1 RNA-binding domain-containing protein [Candidatus Bipolaricaulota bacterium]
MGDVVKGTVTQLKEFGAFVKITPTVEGLIHVSEISEGRIGHPSEVLKTGQEVTAKIIGINEAKRQVRLSIRKLQEEASAEEREAYMAPPGRETIRLGERLKQIAQEE